MSELKLENFINPVQLRVIRSLTKGEEGQFFKDKMDEILNTVNTMPKTGETDGQGHKAIVHLHYFYGGSDWWITERDMEVKQYQAFGYACLNGDWEMSEFGYISIEELKDLGAELDLYWTPISVQEAIEKAKRRG